MPDDREIDRERRHLHDSRTRLAAMRAKVQNLKAAGGDPVSTEFLKASLWRRMKALEDDPEVPLYFGRLDYLPVAGPAADGERLYVGRRHVADDVGDPMVMDWAGPHVAPVLPGEQG